MINYVTGNILESKLQTITCPVNCIGVMGKGLALDFKNTFHGLFQQYKIACLNQQLKIGRPWIYRINDVKQVLCFPTKDDWRNPSTYEYIEIGMQGLNTLYLRGDINSLAIPQLGCGLGGLDWNNVRPIIENYLNKLPIRIDVYGPV